MNYSLLELFICVVKKLPYQSTFHQLKTHYGRSDLWTYDPAIFERDSNTHRYLDAGGSWNTRNCYLSGSLCYGSVTQTHKPILLRESDEPKPYFFPYSVVLLRDGNLLCCWSCTFSLDKRDIGISIFLAFEHYMRTNPILIDAFLLFLSRDPIIAFCGFISLYIFNYKCGNTVVVTIYYLNIFFKFIKCSTYDVLQVNFVLVLVW